MSQIRHHHQIVFTGWGGVLVISWGGSEILRKNVGVQKFCTKIGGRNFAQKCGGGEILRKNAGGGNFQASHDQKNKIFLK